MATNPTRTKIIEGDSLEVLKELPDKHFRLILTDPPYNVSRKNGLRTLNRAGIDFGDWDKGFDQTAWIEAALPKLMPGGSIVIWNDWKNLGDISRYLEDNKVSVKRILTWWKLNPMPRNISRSFVQATEHALWGVVKGKWIFNNREKSEEDRFSSYETGVFEYPVQRSKHPTKKPDGLFQEIIEILTDPGDWVLDPFCGSGTTNLAAKMTGRNSVGIERDPTYVKLAKAAINE